MNSTKTIDLLRKRNAQMQEELMILDELSQEREQYKNLTEDLRCIRESFRSLK